MVYERGFFFLDKGTQHGIPVNQLQGFERWLNQTYLAKEKIKLKIIYIPVRRDKLLDYLAEGRGSGGRQHDGDTDPARTGDLLQPGDHPHRRVGGEPAQPADLQPHYPALWPAGLGAGQLQLLREPAPAQLAVSRAGAAPVYIETVPEYLQDGDLLEMVAAGIIPLTVTDSFKGRIWLGMISGLRAHKLIPLRDNGRSAWALRNNSPELLKAVNDYLADAGKRTLYSDMALRRLLARNDQMSNILAPDPLGRLSTIRKVLEQQADKYRLDWLMLAALAYKESGLNANIRSERGRWGSCSCCRVPAAKWAFAALASPARRGTWRRPAATCG